MTMRVTTALVGIAILIYVLFFAPGVAPPIAFSLLSFLAAYEMGGATKFIGHKGVLWVSCLFAALVPVWQHFGADALLFQGAVLGFLLFLFLVCIFTHGRVAFSSIFFAVFSGLLLPYMLTSLYRIYLMPHGKVLILIPLIAAWGSDIFAQFGGILFGRHKLTPISPKKTVEGLISGVIGSLILIFLFAFIVDRAFDVEISILEAVCAGVFGSLLGQVGDLSFSVIKRQAGIKDYGKIMPGHGGLLDRFDSVIFAASAFELYLQFALR